MCLFRTCNVISAILIHIHHCKYQPVPALVEQFRQLKQHTILEKQSQHLRTKIAESIQSPGIVVSQQTHQELSQVMSSPDSSKVIEQLPESFFQRVFWQQQVEALKKNPKSMYWHPLMIKLGLYPRHQYVIVIDTLITCRTTSVCLTWYFGVVA